MYKPIKEQKNVLEKLVNRLLANRSNLKFLLPSVVLIIWNLFIFGPFTVYSGNISEFDVSLKQIVQHYAILVTISVFILTGVGIFVSKKYLYMYISLIGALGILSWIQGNILVWDYGPLGKGDINWEVDLWRGWIDGGLWIVFLISALLFYGKNYKVVSLVSTALLFLQLPYLVFMSVQNPEIWKNKSLTSISRPEAIFEFSLKRNVIHVVLDEFQSTIFKEIIDEDVERYHTALEGFTFFEEATGSFPTTLMSIPTFFSGQIYGNNIPIEDFINSVYEGETIPNVMYDNGYEVDLAVPFGWYRKGRYTNFYQIPVPYGVTKREHEQANSALMLDLVLFRCVPHFLKRFTYDSQLWVPILNLEKKDVGLIEGARHFAHRAFLQDLIDNSSVKRSVPVYKFIHLTTTHYPAVLNQDCAYSGEILSWDWKNIRIQAKCSFDHFIEFLTKLKLLGIYDSSCIILHADHGYWKIANSANQLDLKNLDKEIYGDFEGYEHLAQVVCSSLPLLAVKLPNSEAPLRVSNAEAALTDIPATIGSILGLDQEFNGRSVFDIDSNEIRERRFLYYDRLNRKGDDFFGRIDEYSIKGNVFDRASWHLDSTHHSPANSYQTQRVDFGTREASGFLRFGWSVNEMMPEEGLTYTWALGKSASLFLCLPKDHAVLLTSNVRTLRFDKPQYVTIKVDGNEVGGWELSLSSSNWNKPWSWDKHSVLIEPVAERPDVSVVEFIFSQYLTPEEGNRENRPLAVLFESISVSKP